MIEVRCKGCNKLLAKATMMVAAIKCPNSKCGMIFEYHIYTNTLHVTDQYANVNSEAQEAQSDNRTPTPVKVR